MTTILEIFRFDLPKAELDAMPAEERALLLLISHASNEIVVLQKLIIMSTIGTSENRIVDHVEAAQGMIIVRILIGKLHEAWQLLQTRFSRSPVGRDYFNKLDDRGKEALEFLRRHFGRGSALSSLRNEVCFHYPSNEDVERAYQAMPREPCTFYLAQHHANSFYLGPETIMNKLLESDRVQGDGGESGLKGLFDLVLAVARKFAELFGKLIVLLCEIHFDRSDVHATALEVGALPPVPFFVDPSSLRIP